MTKVDFYVPMSRMEEVTAWLTATIGPSWEGYDKHNWSYGEEYQSLWFSRECDAVVFKLKWGINENI
jgi:hypothetical protein